MLVMSLGNYTEGCDNSCRVMEGYECEDHVVLPYNNGTRMHANWVTRIASSCHPVACGDGKVEGKEECDDGNLNPFVEKVLDYRSFS